MRLYDGNFMFTNVVPRFRRSVGLSVSLSLDLCVGRSVFGCVCRFVVAKVIDA